MKRTAVILPDEELLDVVARDLREEEIESATPKPYDWSKTLKGTPATLVRQLIEARQSVKALRGVMDLTEQMACLLNALDPELTVKITGTVHSDGAVDVCSMTVQYSLT